MPGFTKSSMLGYYGFLFGNGADGNVTISSNTNLPSTTNGGIVYKNYMNLTINSGCTLSVSNMCQGLWIRVRGTLVLNGTISMSNKGCYIAGGGSNLYLGYSDILVPAVGAAGGTGNVGTGGAGGNGVDGQCGGGGGAGGYISYPNIRGGHGSAGFTGGGGCGGGGGAGAYSSGDSRRYSIQGEDARPYGERGGNGVHCGSSFDTGEGWITGDGYGGGGAGGVTAGASGGFQATPGGVGAGGILIIMANRIEGNGSLLSKGANGGNGSSYAKSGGGGGGGGGGSGGGSITLYYATTSADWPMNAAGGSGGTPSAWGGASGGAGGAGSYRYYSMQQLASHTRI